MKAWTSYLAITFIVVLTLHCRSQTVRWGVPGEAVVIDSNGDAIHDRYVFQLGAFALNYDPDVPNVGDWLTHWRVFDALPSDNNYLSTIKTVDILPDVMSGSLHPTADTSFSFAGLDAYVWVRDSDDPVPGTNWFLGWAAGWTFPNNIDSSPNFDWNLDDLGPTDIPEWGRHNAVRGPGVCFSHPTINGIQALTFIPEPSSAMMVLVSGFGLLLRRRRSN